MCKGKKNAGKKTKEIRGLRSSASPHPYTTFYTEPAEVPPIFPSAYSFFLCSLCSMVVVGGTSASNPTGKYLVVVSMA